jgi:hypothetical protein
MVRDVGLQEKNTKNVDQVVKLDCPRKTAE